MKNKKIRLNDRASQEINHSTAQRAERIFADGPQAVLYISAVS
jgi:hypothetical protein